MRTTGTKQSQGPARVSGKTLHENQAGPYLTNSGGGASVELPKLGQRPVAREEEFYSVRYN
jgi:hypothetical protein